MKRLHSLLDYVAELAAGVLASVLTWTMVVIGLWQGVVATLGEGHEMPFLAVLLVVHLLAMAGIWNVGREDEPEG